MLLEKEAILVLAGLATLFISFAVVDGSKARTLKHHLKSGKFIQDSEFLTNPGQVYGSCFEMKTYGNKFQAHCTFALENIKPITSSDHQRFCHFILHLDNVDNQTEYSAKSVVAIDKNKAILTLKNDKFSKFFVLHFIDCRAVPVKMDFEPKKAIIVAPLDDLFDIITTDADDFCTSEAPCKTVVDTEGNIITQTKKWFDGLDKLVAIIHTPTLGRLVVDEHGESLKSLNRIYVVDDRGTIRHLWARPVHKVHHTIKYDRLIVSTTNHMLTTCFARDGVLTCGQFLLDGKIKFEIVLPIHRHLSMRSLNIHNLPSGGFLLVAAECLEKDEADCSEAKDSFFIYKIDTTGSKFGKLKSMKPSRIDPKLLHFFENIEDGMCLSHAMQQNETAVLDVICFNNNDFMEINI